MRRPPALLARRAPVGQGAILLLLGRATIARRATTALEQGPTSSGGGTGRAATLLTRRAPAGDILLARRATALQGAILLLLGRAPIARGATTLKQSPMQQSRGGRGGRGTGGVGRLGGGRLVGTGGGCVTGCRIGGAVLERVAAVLRAPTLKQGPAPIGGGGTGRAAIGGVWQGAILLARRAPIG